MEGYNVSRGQDDNGNLWNIKILKIGGSQDITAPNIPTNPMSQPLKIRKVKIGMEGNPKFANVGDYWDE